MKKLASLTKAHKLYRIGGDTFQEVQQLDAIRIINHSGGKSIDKIHRLIRPLKKKHYDILPQTIDGNAPKDFIRMYEYKKGKANPKPKWDKYIAKIGHKWYPLESITEYMLNCIGEVMGLNMAASQLRLVHGQIRFLSKYFLEEGDILVHGAQLYSACLLENDDRFVEEIERNKLSRSLLSFQITNEAVRFSFPDQHSSIMTALVELLAFDAIIGNNDRHFYNWAVITDLEGKKAPTFSPIYDTARGLFWNVPESTIEKKYYQGKGKNEKINTVALEAYIQSSRPKIGWEDWNEKKEINHFQLLELIYKYYPEYQNICKNLFNSLNLQNIQNLLGEKFKPFFQKNVIG